MKSSPLRPAILLLGWVLLALGSSLVAGLTLGLELAILCLAAAVGLAVVMLFWQSVHNLAGETPLSIDEALSMGAPTAAEEQKRSVLRALKDLEFERSVGKISEPDYLEFSARYRAEAKRLMAAVDQSLGPVQELAEKLVATRLAQAGLLPLLDAIPKLESQSEPEPESKPEPAASVLESNDRPAAAPLSGRRCSSCATHNDLDARFCKRCGVALAVDERQAVQVLAEEETP